MVKRKHGYTVIELMIVVAIVGILVAVVVQKFNGPNRTSVQQAFASGKCEELLNQSLRFLKDYPARSSAYGIAYQNCKAQGR